MNTHITNIKGDWQEVVDTCRATSGKGPLGHEPSEDFKRRILIAEHSPIRRISVSTTRSNRNLTTTKESRCRRKPRARRNPRIGNF